MKPLNLRKLYTQYRNWCNKHNLLPITKSQYQKRYYTI